MTALVERPRPGRLVDQFERGLDAPICLTWELTYACNLACVHCLSSSGRRDPRELSTAEGKALIDEFERMQIFYVNIGGGEPTVRPDFWELLDYAIEHHVGVKFSTNGFRITRERARRLAATDYVDVQVSLDGATAEVNDAVRGRGHLRTALRAMEHLADAGMQDFKLSVVCTRAEHRPARRVQGHRRPVRRPAAPDPAAPLGSWRRRVGGPAPLAEQQRELYDWLVAHGENVLTGDSFFHLSAFGDALPGLNLCGAGRVVCLVDPVGDVYACPFAIHDQFLAGTCATGRLQPGVAGLRALHSSSAARRPAGRAPAAPRTTPAAAGAWRPSSSPACRSTGPTPSASRATPLSRRRTPVRHRAVTTRTSGRCGTHPSCSPCPPAGPTAPATRTRWPGSRADRDRSRREDPPSAPPPRPGHRDVARGR